MTPARVVRYPRNWWRLNWLGSLAGLFGFWAAITPSLLPRPASLQGAVAGLGAIFGYGIGTLISHGVRRALRAWTGLQEPSRKAKRIAWWVLFALGLAVAIAGTIFARVWQNQVRELVSMPPEEPVSVLLFFGTALFFFALILFIGRGIRWLTRMAIRPLKGIVPGWLATAIGVVLVGAVLYWILSGLVINSLISVADSIYSGTNNTTAQGVEQPTTSLRSGGQGSLVSWDSLGFQGRNFIGRGPSVQQLTTFGGKTAMEPIRVYVGYNSAPTIPERAVLAVKELERTGAFDRSVLLVTGTTGTGWLEPQSTDSLEYMWNGDTAIVGIQYSYLPSWMSTLVDAQRAQEAGKALFDAVYAKWKTLPSNHRPKLIAYGLSLGSFSIQSAFADANDIVNRTDGAVFVGSPNFSEPWGTITANREPSSPEWQPVYQNGQHIRFAVDPKYFASPAAPWDQPRTVYLQHASDPVVWWAPKLIYSEPDWLKGQKGPDVDPRMTWYPFVTWVQVTVDQFVGTLPPAGHGHNYGNAMVDAWNAVVPPPGWTADDTARLNVIIDGYSIE